ncbi:hypothetical protein AAXB25_32270 [Paenibacillus lautus]|uniref:hypothetical protein n=1 Tax=Paenibacillus lautus TaxID=1401 RepID=UPI003D28A337
MNTENCVCGSVIVAERVDFNYEKTTHSIENIYNTLTVNVVPSVAFVDVWAKVAFSMEQSVEAWIEIINSNNELIFTSNPMELENYRETNMHPGADFSLSIRFLVTKEGNYTVKLVVNNNEVYAYPLFVKCRMNE